MKTKHLRSKFNLQFSIFFLGFLLLLCLPLFASNFLTYVNEINESATLNNHIELRKISISDILPKPTPPEKHRWAPSISKLLNVPDFNVEKGTIIVQSEFIDFGKIRESSYQGSNIIVNSEGKLFDFAFGVTENIELSYTKANFNIDPGIGIHDYIGSKEFNGDLYSVKLTKKILASLTENKTTSFGIVYSYLSNNLNDVKIAQVGLEKRSLQNDVIIGIGIIDIEGIERKSSVGGFIGIKQNIKNAFDFSVEYSYKQPLKLILNKVIKTKWQNLGELSCENCREDSLNIGVNFKLGDKGLFNLYILDTNDLVCPMIQTIVKF